MITSREDYPGNGMSYKSVTRHLLLSDGDAAQCLDLIQSIGWDAAQDYYTQTDFVMLTIELHNMGHTHLSKHKGVC